MPRYGFGGYVVDTDSFEVTGPDGPTEFEPQVFSVLQYLVEQAGRLVTKEELLDNVWGDRFVSESALTTRIKQARRIIGDDGRTQWAIKTVHGRGYRFLPEVNVEAATASGPITAPAPAAPLPEQLQAETRHRFVGRNDELARAQSVIDAHEDGPISWIWVLGEPGIGKTRAAAEIAKHAQERGHRVLFGRNNEDLAVPYQPFLDVLRAVLAGAETTDGGAEPLGSHTRELARLVPEALAGRDDEPAEPGTVDDQVQRYRLYEAIGGWLADASADTPMCIVVDDAHWAADSTLQLLAHLAHRPEPARVTMVVTARDTAPDTNPRVADLIASAQGATSTTVLRLEGLERDAAARLVGSEADLDAVMTQTAGNPLLLQAINPDDGTVDVGSAVRRRLASLDDAVQDLLGVASVVGFEFELKIVAAATGRGELDVLDDLEQAVAARLLDDVGIDRFRFTHALIRSSLGGELSSGRRARVHASVAEAIETVFGDDRRHLQELAHHTAEAALADPALAAVAIDRLMAAATESADQLSFEEAARTVARARALADPGDHSLAARLAIAQGTAELRAGLGVVAMGTFDDAITAARAAADPRLQIDAVLGYEDASWRPGLVGIGALERITGGLAALDEAERSDLDLADTTVLLRTRLEIGRVRALAMSGAASEAVELATEVMPRARSLDDPVTEAQLLNVLIGHLRLFTAPSALQEAAARLSELQPHLDDLDVAVHAIEVRIVAAALAGRFDDFDHLQTDMNELLAYVRSGFWAYVGANHEAMMAFHRADLEGCEQLAERCLGMAADLPGDDGTGAYGLRMFMIRREQDRLEALAPMIRLLVSDNPSDSFWIPGLALLLVETGDDDRAAELLTDLTPHIADIPRDALWATVMVLLTETAVQLGDRNACALLREQLLPFAGDCLVGGAAQFCFGSTDRYLGMLSLVVGELAEAEEQLATALEADAAGGSALWSNESRLWLSRVRRAQGHLAEADAMAEVVAEQADAAGLSRLRRLAIEDRSP